MCGNARSALRLTLLVGRSAVSALTLTAHATSISVVCTVRSGGLALLCTLNTHSITQIKKSLTQQGANCYPCAMTATVLGSFLYAVRRCKIAYPSVSAMVTDSILVTAQAHSRHDSHQSSVDCCTSHVV